MPMTKIQTITLGTTASLIEFTSIPQTGTHLILELSARTNRSAIDDWINIRINNDSTAYYQVYRLAFQTSVSATFIAGDTTVGQAALVNGNTSTTNAFSNTEVFFSFYTDTKSKQLSIDSVVENNATTAARSFVSGFVDTTSAITSIQITSNTSSNFLANTTATLYALS